MSHKPPHGYEHTAFFGRNCHTCLCPEDGTPYEAACKLACKLEGSYIIEEEAGWTVYAPTEEKLPAEVELAIKTWLETPVEETVARWKKEMGTGS